MDSKAEVFDEISQLLGLRDIPLSVGATVPRQFFSEIAERMHLSDSGSSLDVAKRIVASQGQQWPSDGDSSSTPSGGGGTITTSGLSAIREAVIDFLEVSDGMVEPNIANVAPQLVRSDWTYFIGQSISRSVLASRYGAAKVGDIVSSSDGAQVFVFTESGDDRFLVRGGARINSEVRIRFDLLKSDLDASAVQSLSLLVSQPRLDRHIRLLEGTSGIVKYLGEYQLIGFDSNLSPQLTNSVSGWIEISLASINIQKREGHLERDESSQVAPLDAFAPYMNVDLASTELTSHDPFEVDPSVIEASTAQHYDVQNAVADWLRSHSLVPLRSTKSELQVDVAWHRGPQLFIAEVKSCSAENQTLQFRLGLGQALDYAEEFRGQPVVVLGMAPASSRLIAVAARVGVTLLWPALLKEISPWDL